MDTHQRLWKACKDRAGYLYMHVEHKPDCSCGCKWFLELSGDEGADWGVCYNPKSPRCGLLTFEHMGCPYFVYNRKDGDHV